MRRKLRRQRLLGALLLALAAVLFIVAMNTSGDNGCGAGSVVFLGLGTMLITAKRYLFY